MYSEISQLVLLNTKSITRIKQIFNPTFIRMCLCECSSLIRLCAFKEKKKKNHIIHISWHIADLQSAVLIFMHNHVTKSLPLRNSTNLHNAGKTELNSSIHILSSHKSLYRTIIQTLQNISKPFCLRIHCFSREGYGSSLSVEFKVFELWLDVP